MDGNPLALAGGRSPVCCYLKTYVLQYTQQQIKRKPLGVLLAEGTLNTLKSIFEVIAYKS